MISIKVADGTLPDEAVKQHVPDNPVIDFETEE